MSSALDKYEAKRAQRRAKRLAEDLQDAEGIISTFDEEQSLLRSENAKLKAEVSKLKDSKDRMEKDMNALRAQLAQPRSETIQHRSDHHANLFWLTKRDSLQMDLPPKSLSNFQDLKKALTPLLLVAKCNGDMKNLSEFAWSHATSEWVCFKVICWNSSSRTLGTIHPPMSICPVHGPDCHIMIRIVSGQGSERKLVLQKIPGSSSL